MDKKIKNFLDKLLENNILDQQIYENIMTYEEHNKVSQKSKVAKALTLIGGFFVFSGLLGTLPLIWENLYLLGATSFINYNNLVFILCGWIQSKN